MPVMAGPFAAADFENLIPSDKKLSAEWIQSLFARGARTLYRGAELENIGMPIGGICTGQLYLGGDGKLWHWDIFNSLIRTGSAHYAEPLKPDSPIEQGFAIRIRSRSATVTRTLDRAGFADISFCGEYPIGYVEYRDPESPVSVSLEAFSPFIPLNPHDSHLPATILQFTVKNTAKEKVDCDLAGWLENAVCCNTRWYDDVVATNAVVRQASGTLLNCTAAAATGKVIRPPVVFADFEAEDYGAWTVEGEAFGNAPAKGAPSPEQHLSGFLGKGLANSWAGSDAPQGKLTSPPFTIERPFINFLVGGGDHSDETGIRLLVDGKVVRSRTARNSDAMVWESWYVREFASKTATLEIIDLTAEKWGHFEVDQIEFSDTPHFVPAPPPDREDYGSMSLALLDAKPDDLAAAAVPAGPLPQSVFDGAGTASQGTASKEYPERLVGAVARKLSLEPGQQAAATFVVAWYFPKIQHLNDTAWVAPSMAKTRLENIHGRQYGKRFDSARAVVEYIAANFARLHEQTRLWHDTWYDSTLPYWFLDRTFLNTSTLATSTAYWFGNGRFYGWEGVGCCPGTCQHVWQYAHAMARIFPTLERTNREMVDFGLAFHEDTGAMDLRGEFEGIVAVDGQAGTILRAYREHQMSPDHTFLRRNWPRIKKSLERLIQQDADHDGILDGSQHNTLDAPWFGRIAWLSSLYVAALRAGEQMALEMDDETFARQARSLAEAGTDNIDRQLFNGEYFIQIGDKDHPNTVGSYDGCDIDQVFGQSWAFQVGLERVLPREHTLSALRSLWKYNFTPDVGAYRKINQPGWWLAQAGDGGLIMCTWPKGDKLRVQKDYDFYFNQCMSGFEHQVAGHMIWEGMVQEGLAIIRAIHDRYHASRRNPWNEVECGDHYSRAMASYGVFLAACGYRYHGPKRFLAFAPRLTPEDFRAAFTTAEGWGVFQQHRQATSQTERIEVRWGKLCVKSLAFELPENAAAGQVAVSFNGQQVPFRATASGREVQIVLAEPAVVEPDRAMDITITLKER